MNTRRLHILKSAAAFPLVLWFAATFFLLGDTGRWLDDWFYVQRVPESGEIRSLVLDRPVHFWRPLYRVIVPALATVLDENTRLHHLVCALAHGLNALLLWSLLIRLGLRRLAASIAALFFLVYPASFEVVFWLCNLPTALSTSACLGALILITRIAQRRSACAMGWVGELGASSALLAVTVFVAACLNEQPPAMLAAAPLVCCMAVGRPLLSRDLLRCSPLLAAVVGAVAFYAICHHRFVPIKPSVDGDSFFVSLGRIPSVTAAVAHWTWEWVVSTGSMRRMLWHAGQAAAEHPVRTALVLTALIASAALWVRDHVERGHEAPMSTEAGAARPLSMIVLGGVIGLASIAPIIATNYWLNPRVLYAPSVGLAVILGGLCMIPGSRCPFSLATKRRERLCAAVVAVIALSVMAWMMVGVQRTFQTRDRIDAQALEQLERLVPLPPPGSVFVPVQIESPSSPVWAARYEQQFWSIFRSRWSSSWAIQLHYGRGDIYASHALHGPAWFAPNMQSVNVVGVGRVEWERVIPFSLDSNGHVRLVPDVQWTTPTRADRRLRLKHLPFPGHTSGAPFAFPPPLERDK
jgi:hypothetical protein